MKLSRRSFLAGSMAATVAALGRPLVKAAQPKPADFRLRHVVSTSLFGNLPIEDIARQVRILGGEGLDIWAGRWGNQREQIEAMGEEKFQAVLKSAGTRVCCYTCMDTGFFKAAPHMRAMKQFGGEMIVANLSGTSADRNRQGSHLRTAVRKHAEKLKPAIAEAGEAGVKLAIENHSGGALLTPEAIEMLVEAIPDPHVGIALAPYHLPQDAQRLGRLVDTLGERLFYFYAWQHGDGSGELPPERQRLQMPGAGPLDFKPMLAALKRIRFAGWTSVFMHPTPRGSSIHPSLGATTEEILRGRAFIDAELAKT